MLHIFPWMMLLLHRCMARRRQRCVLHALHKYSSNITDLPQDLLQRYSTVRGGFNPPPPRNPRNSSKRHGPTAALSIPPIASPPNEQHLRSYFREAREFRLNDALRRAVFRMKTQVSRIGGEKEKAEKRRKHRG